MLRCSAHGFLLQAFLAILKGVSRDSAPQTFFVLNKSFLISLCQGPVDCIPVRIPCLPFDGVVSGIMTRVESGFSFLIPILVLLLLRGRQGSVFCSTAVCRSTWVSTSLCCFIRFSLFDNIFICPIIFNLRH